MNTFKQLRNILRFAVMLLFNLFVILAYIGHLRAFQSCEYMLSGLHILFMFNPPCSEHVFYWVSAFFWIIPTIAGLALYRCSAIGKLSVFVSIIPIALILVIPSSFKADDVFQRIMESRYELLGAYIALIYCFIVWFYNWNGKHVSQLACTICIALLALQFLLPMPEIWRLPGELHILLSMLLLLVAYLIGCVICRFKA